MSFSKSSVRYFRDYKHLAREYYSQRIFVAVDTETTGLHAEDDYIMEIGAVKFNCGGAVGEPFSSLVKPPVSINPFLTKLTHITDAMLQDAPSANSVLPEFLRWLGGKEPLLLAHNAPFDLYFINAELDRLNLPPLKNLVLDTLPLSRWAYPALAKEGTEGSYKLQSLASRLGIKAVAAHRAQDDARVCKELFERIIKDTLSVQKDTGSSTGYTQLELFELNSRLTT